jgi:heme/copper-type cytochrome/quinol oxidase subunit 3
MSTRSVIDVSELPSHEFDTYDPVWWGNNGLLAIETAMFAILIATYFYLRQNFALWPPPIAQLTAPLRPLPLLGYGTANTILLLVAAWRRSSHANWTRDLFCLRTQCDGTARI